MLIFVYYEVCIKYHIIITIYFKPITTEIQSHTKKSLLFIFSLHILFIIDFKSYMFLYCVSINILCSYSYFLYFCLLNYLLVKLVYVPIQYSLFVYTFTFLSKLYISICFHVATRQTFISLWRTPFNVECKTGPVVMSCLSFCFTKDCLHLFFIFEWQFF